MKDNNQHIVTQIDDKLSDWIMRLMSQFNKGTVIEYRDYANKQDWDIVQDDHKWDFNSLEYRYINPREYIIQISKEGEASIEDTVNHWTRSDFGKISGGGEYILMRQVDPYEEEK